MTAFLAGRLAALTTTALAVKEWLPRAKTRRKIAALLAAAPSSTVAAA